MGSKNSTGYVRADTDAKVAKHFGGSGTESYPVPAVGAQLVQSKDTAEAETPRPVVQQQAQRREDPEMRYPARDILIGEEVALERSLPGRLGSEFFKEEKARFELEKVIFCSQASEAVVALIEEGKTMPASKLGLVETLAQRREFASKHGYDPKWTQGFESNLYSHAGTVYFDLGTTRVELADECRIVDMHQNYPTRPVWGAKYIGFIFDGTIADIYGFIQRMVFVRIMVASTGLTMPNFFVFIFSAHYMTEMGLLAFQELTKIVPVCVDDAFEYEHLERVEDFLIYPNGDGPVRIVGNY